MPNSTYANDKALYLRAISRSIPFSLALLLCGVTAAAPSLEEANLQIQAGQTAKALKSLDNYLAGQPKDPQARFLKGVALSELNKTKEALAVFKKLTEDHPDLPEPYNNIAVIHARLNQLDLAKEALEKAIHTHPAYATAYHNLGDIHLKQARLAYGKALLFAPVDSTVQIKLAMIGSLDSTGKPFSGPTAPKEPVLATSAPVIPPAATVNARPEPKSVEPSKLAATSAGQTKPSSSAESSQSLAQHTDAKPAAAKTPRTTRQAESEIAGAIDNWLAAWSRKDIKAYLSSYAPDFKVPDGRARKAWETERTQRIAKPGKIEVSRDKLGIKIEGDNKALVNFRQHYRSATFTSSSGKSVVLVRLNGQWLIQQEHVGG